LPTILLNSHMDTVESSESWSDDPFDPIEKNGKIFGLGSNDAGASLVSLLAVYMILYGESVLPYNLVFAVTAEEEISGKKGIGSILEDLPGIELGIVGEPTQMKLAIAEKGLIVLDCIAEGKSGHAAKSNGINAIYEAMDDIDWIRNYEFAKESPLLGKVSMQVTRINAGLAHNIIPDKCSYVVDVRTNELYTNKEILTIIADHLSSDVQSRSLRLNSTYIPEDHPVVRTAKEMGIECFGSDTLSDQAIMPFNTVKMGPGDSRRSHTANEFIYKEEISAAIDIYLQLMKKLTLNQIVT